MSTALILLSGWDPPVVAQFALERQAELKAALSLYNKPIDTQEQADEVAALIGECERWESDIEDASVATRKPYFDHAKKIKAVTDECQRVIIDARRPVQNHLANFEAEKLRVKQQLERQAQQEAERKRQELEAKAQIAQTPEMREKFEAQAAAVVAKPVTWEAPKTEGVSAGTELEFEVVNEREFAEWCWANGRSSWVRRIEFEKRPITEELAKVPDTAPVPVVPGLAIRRVAAVRVKKAKRQAVHDVATTRIEM
jgi:hypothetical protein